MNSKNIKEYKRPDWVNVSKGNWSFLSCTEFVNHYTREVLVGGRNPFDTPLQVCAQGRSELWFLQSEIDSFGHYVVSLFNSREKIHDLCANAKKESDTTRLFFREHAAQEFDATLYRQMWKSIRSYYQYHLPLKYIGDYLPSNTLEENKQILYDTRKYTEPLFEESEDLVRRVIALVGGRTGITNQLVSCFTREELGEYFGSGAFPDRTALEDRYKKAILWASKDVYGFFTGEEAKQVESFFYSSGDKSVKGMSAYSGFARGVVRLVNDPARTQVFNDGDILVTGMTRPNYVPLIKKSAAVVTDAGGILSHAAIVARELKKPCIIGTKIATKVLKDGDLVEVDAEKGVVKVLKRNESTS